MNNESGIIKKRYWLRVGIILGILHFIAWVGTLLLSLSATDGVSRAFAWFPLGLVDFLIAPLMRLGGSLGVSDTVGGGAILFLIFGTTQWLLIGAVVGWLYGKIKSRKPPVPNV